MTLQEKLDFIDSEIRKIHMFCTKSGYTSSQVESLAKSFFERDGHSFGTDLWVSGKAWKRRAVALAAMAVTILFLLRFDPAYRLVCAVSKQGAIKILPLWDWTKIYHSRCWVENPLFQDTTGPQLSDCEICEGIDNLARVEKLSGDELTEYLNRDLPVIVEDGTWDWGNTNNITIQELAQVYADHPILKNYYSCGFSSNIRTRNSDHMDLLYMIKNGQMDRYYAQWENCNILAAKAFRQMYKRPYFLPLAISLSQANWLFISANYSGKIYKPVDVREGMLIFVQVRGQSLVRLKAWDLCSDICSQFEDVLHEGEILVATTFIWRLDYIPSSSPENIAIAIGATFK